MVFTLRVPRAIAQGPAWPRVVSIIQNATATAPARRTAGSAKSPIAVGISERAAH